MTVKRALLAAIVVLAVAPAAASAGTLVFPPAHDQYLRAKFISDELARLKLNDPRAFVADTSSYTTQADMFNPRFDGTPGSGGPKEPTKCGDSVYGKTIWSVFYTHQYGRMVIRTSGPFDSVIGVVPFKSPEDPTPNIGAGLCYDGLFGFDESASFLVNPKRWYAVQVGGVGPSGGNIQVKFELTKPPTVGGQAFLSWKTGPLRVTDLHVKSVPKGQRITLSCTQGSCSRKTISVKSKVVARRLGTDVGAGPFARAQTKRAVVRDAQARVQVLKNRKVKPGSKIELRITRPGYIGKYYVWTVSKNGVSASQLSCLNPGSNKPRTKCTG
jgi:hypothetical protein